MQANILMSHGIANDILSSTFKLKKTQRENKSLNMNFIQCSHSVVLLDFIKFTLMFL
jgi:hypothetical protein